MNPEKYDWFMSRKPPRRAVLGAEYYIWNGRAQNDDVGRLEFIEELV